MGQARAHLRPERDSPPSWPRWPQPWRSPLPAEPPPAGALHFYHGTASNGQYLNLTTGPKRPRDLLPPVGACRPGFIHLLVNPVVLLNRAPLSPAGSFSKTPAPRQRVDQIQRKGQAQLRHRARAGPGNKICDGTDVTFKLKLIQ